MESGALSPVTNGMSTTPLWFVANWGTQLQVRPRPYKPHPFNQCICIDAIAVGGARYGETNGRINMHQVQCTGAEDSLLDCNYITFTVFRDHDEDAGVKCYEEGQYLCQWIQVYIDVYYMYTAVQ